MVGRIFCELNNQRCPRVLVQLCVDNSDALT
jgi:hypothetical protein